MNISLPKLKFAWPRMTPNLTLSPESNETSSASTSSVLEDKVSLSPWSTTTGVGLSDLETAMKRYEQDALIRQHAHSLNQLGSISTSTIAAAKIDPYPKHTNFAVEKIENGYLVRVGNKTFMCEDIKAVSERVGAVLVQARLEE